MAKTNTEALHQKAFFKWLYYEYPDIYKITWHTPNGGKRNAIEASKFKELGVKPGVPDVFIAFPSKGWHGLFIEFKAGKNKLTPSQSNMINALAYQYYRVVVCYSVDDAIKVVEEYINV